MIDEQNHLTTVLDLERYWPYHVTVLADRIARRTSNIVKQHKLNLSQWRVLAAVADSPGRTSKEVVRITPMDKGIVSRATKALLELGLIRREASQQDGRISHLHMTPQGERLYAEIMPKVRSAIQPADQHFSNQERVNLIAQLRKMIGNLPGAEEI